MTAAQPRHAAAAREIRRVWKTAWLGSNLQIPVEIDNLPFQQPVGAPWGRLSVVTGNTTAVSLGAAMTRTPFILQLQVFIPEHQGTNQARLVADQMAVIDGTTHRTEGLLIRFETTSIAGTGTQGGAAAFLITIPGTYDADAEILA